MRNAIERVCLVLVGLVFAASGLQAGRQIVLSHRSQRDFRVYFIAASMIWNHQGSHLYDQAADGTDPQRAWADPNTVFAAYARKLGVDDVHLYVYPPLLADMLVPLVSLQMRCIREHAWLLLNVIFVFAAALILLYSSQNDFSEPGSPVLAPSVARSSAVPSDAGLLIVGSGYVLLLCSR